MTLLGQPRALYVHVPFCPAVCPYCDFHKMRRDEGLVARYLARLEAEAADLGRRFPGPLDTVYLGGGTPSHLTNAELERVLAAVEGAWGWPPRVEATLEADPLTFDAKRARTWRGWGFGRVSVGVQSTQDAVLRFLGRLHDGRQGLAALAGALAAGLDVNADVILAVPGQNAEEDLRHIAATGVRHVSTYGLTVEPHTPFAFRGVRVDPDRDADDYERAQEVLPEYGLERYEVSNHAAPGHEAQHNLAVWRGEAYLALGPGATSFLPPEDGPAGVVGVRRKAPSMKAWLAGGLPAEVTLVDGGRYVADALMLGLRTGEGVDLARLAAQTGRNLRAEYGPAIARLQGDGLLHEEGVRLRATPRGLAVLNWTLAELLEPEPDRERAPPEAARSLGAWQGPA